MSVSRHPLDAMRATGRRVRTVLPWSVTACAGTFAVATAAPLFLARLVLNAPLATPLDVGGAYDLLALLAVVGPAIAAITLGATTADDRAGIGILFVGVFGLLAPISGAATVPAALAVAGGGALALAALVHDTEWGRRMVGILGTAAVAVTLAGALGFSPAALRPAGSRLALLTLAVTPFAVGGDRRLAVWALGALAGAGVVWAATARPFVTGAVNLVTGGIVGTPILVTAVGVAGATTALASTLRRRRTVPALGVTLLVLAGVPGTLLRAVPAVLGLVLLVGGDEL